MCILAGRQNITCWNRVTGFGHVVSGDCCDDDSPEIETVENTTATVICSVPLLQTV